MVWRGQGQEDGLTGFWHHGVRLSDGSVVHYSGMDGMKTLHNSVVTRTPMRAFATEAHRRVHEVAHARRYPPAAAERRALSKVGHANYDLLFDNCESFAQWCVTGEFRSFQGQGAIFGAVAAVGSLALGGGIAGAVLTGVVAHKFWDRSGNRSEHREPPEDEPD